MLTKELESLLKAESLLFGGVESNLNVGFDKIVQSKNLGESKKGQQVTKLAELESIHDHFLIFNDHIV